MASDKYKAQQTYKAKYEKPIKFSCYSNTEQDIIDRLAAAPNRAGYIKELIREDIKKHPDRFEKNK